MAASDIEICNRALHKLGAGTIVTLNDNNERARVLKVAFNPVREAELRRHTWRFSIKRTSLPALSARPDSGYARQFELPGDCLRLLDGGDLLPEANLADYRGGENAYYTVEGRQILTDLPAPLAIRYVRNVTDVALMDPAFVESFATRLAYESCERITESTTKRGDLREDYRSSISEALRSNAIEASSSVAADDTWVMARRG